MKGSSSPIPPRSAGSKQQRAVRENEAQAIRFALVWPLAALVVAAAGAAIYFGRSRPAPPSTTEPVSHQAPRREPARAADRNESTPTALPQDPVSSVFGKLVRPPADRSANELVAQLTDPAQPLPVRRKAARSLGRIGSDEAINALKRTVVEAPADLKAAIAEGLGESTHSDAVPMLHSLLEDRDEAAARGAIRGFAARGDASSVEVLSGVLRDAARATSLRIWNPLSVCGYCYRRGDGLEDCFRAVKAKAAGAYPLRTCWNPKERRAT